uniref:3-isopropylmalate dehydratase large subunit n=1 Tax=Candidatus Kentrum sp. LFY TaxID=2126342 RepID=A0A450WFM9_9GAMM|nr:MAG: 3-isopropylmalate dehydratase, large subunit [Candidatus Kentron sp. LFY]
MTAKTLYDKLWSDHVVRTETDGTVLLYIDRHFLHEVTSPQAFQGLKIENRPAWREDTSLAVADHNVPTTDRAAGIKDPVSRLQVETLVGNCLDFKIQLFGMRDPRQGIVHVIGPEQGATLPGMTIVCGDSHTSTHGALGALAFGIGTSDVEHVLATQCLPQKKSKSMLISIDGALQPGVSAKDAILTIIGKIGTAGATGYTIEFGGDVIRSLSIEGRMAMCNMAIEAGARTGLVAVDENTVDYVRGRPFAPTGKHWEQAQQAWRQLRSDPSAVFDRVERFDGNTIVPMVTWGTSPEMVIPITGKVPDPADEQEETKRIGMERALSYMDLAPDTPMTQIALDKVFIGSCTNARIEDLRAVADVVRGLKIANNIKLALVVPGSGLVKTQAEEEGLAKVFTEAGFQWREPGCSLCLAMNADRLEPGERCASTSNRNFEGRQGRGGRTHLASPTMVAAAAIAGHFVDVREMQNS